MLHTVLLAIAFALFLIGSVNRHSKINYNALGLAVLSVAMFVGQDLHIHLQLDPNSSQHNITLTRSFHP